MSARWGREEIERWRYGTAPGGGTWAPDPLDGVSPEVRAKIEADRKRADRNDRFAFWVPTTVFFIIPTILGAVAYLSGHPEWAEGLWTVSVAALVLVGLALAMALTGVVLTALTTALFFALLPVVRFIGRELRRQLGPPG